MNVEQIGQSGPVAVLASGGLDSAILIGDLARVAPRVFPIYVHFGLIWESAEERSLRQFLQALDQPAVEPLRVFQIPMESIYGEHWSATGRGTPGRESPDETVFLPGRTMLLLTQAAIWCHLQRVPTIALGMLAGNPFPDSTEGFLGAYERLVNTALGSAAALRLVAPYRGMSKREVLERGRAMPLGSTLSCLRPQGDVHCGACNKCGERQRAFAAAEIPDPTHYRSSPTRCAGIV